MLVETNITFKRSLDEIANKAEEEPPTENVMDHQPATEVNLENIQPANFVKRNAFEALDGTAVTDPDTKGINMRTELEKLWNNNVFQSKKAMGKMCLLFWIQCNHGTRQQRSKKVHNDDMTVVAISFDQRQWDTMFEESYWQQLK